jgi:C_GCAxxG_C_C family probable redox protein
MNKMDQAAELYKQGYLCSQAVFAAFCEEYGIDKISGIKLSKFLGAGYLYRGDYCGAISGALMIYGLEFDLAESDNELADERFYHFTREHLKRFKEKNGSCFCRELLDADISTNEGLDYVRTNRLMDTKCPGFVRDSAEIIIQILNEMKYKESYHYFEKVAKDWDRMQKSFFSDSSRKKIFALANISNGDTIADIGAGTGYITEGLLDKSVNIIAVDESEAMLNEMKKKLGSTNIEYRLGESENLPLNNEEVSFAFANMYLHHVDNPGKSIKEMTRVMKKGGKLIITDMDEHGFDFLRTEQMDKWLGFKRDDIKQWFEEAGLLNVSVDCVGEKCCTDSEYEKDTRAEISIFIAYGEKSTT